MIDAQLLRRVVLQAIKGYPSTQFASILHETEQIFTKEQLFPSQACCGDDHVSYRYYQDNHLAPVDKTKLNEILWDLIIERILTVGIDECNPGYPFVRLTDFGKMVIEDEAIPYYNPDQYRDILKSLAPGIDRVVEQYAVEGVKCFRQRLFFASAVMLGAAAESALLSLLQAMAVVEAEHKQKAKMLDLINRPNLPDIFNVVKLRIDALIKTKRIPYKVHEGATEHLLSLLEMIRVQRNEAVHPAIGEVSQMKVFLSIQSLPAALNRVFKLKSWFEEK